jgi:MFS family permease
MVIGFTTRDTVLFYIMVAIAQVTSSMALGAAAATTQDLVLPRMRGAATATFFLGTTLIGLALGPYLAGFLSQAFGDLGYGVHRAAGSRADLAGRPALPLPRAAGGRSEPPRPGPRRRRGDLAGDCRRRTAQAMRSPLLPLGSVRSSSALAWITNAAPSASSIGVAPRMPSGS